MKNMFCPKCGTQLSDNESFCYNCGVPLSVNGAAKKKIWPLILIGSVVALLLAGVLVWFIAFGDRKDDSGREAARESDDYGKDRDKEAKKKEEKEEAACCICRMGS
ncbi:MAG: zinc-ribbon domain-containing protein [Lachnospiraceae bacterium]|nr:zinc-ribbon domain-containing protein [Lachnospiraceae bacterium]